MDSVQLVTITHYIDPSRFYCRNLATADDDRQKVADLEEKLKTFASGNKTDFVDSADELKIGAWVGYYDEYSKKWIRCEIDKVARIGGANGDQDYIFLWAVDYGFPFHTTKLSKLTPLPGVLKHPSSRIFVAGLGAMPVSINFDHINIQMQAKIGEIWTERAIKTFEQCIREAQTVYFIPSTRVSHHQVLIGDLNVTSATTNDFVQVTKMLVDADLAIIPPNTEFAKCYNRLLTPKIERWNDYRRTGGVLKLPSDLMLSPITLELAGDTDGSSSINESYREAINRKVRDWQRRNDSCSSSDLGSEVGSPPPSVTTFLNSTLPKKLEQRLAATKSNIERKQKKLFSEMKNMEIGQSEQKISTASQKRVNNPVFVAAGAAYGESKNRRVWQAKSLKSCDDLDNEEFISVSQVGSTKQDDGFD